MLNIFSKGDVEDVTSVSPVGYKLKKQNTQQYKINVVKQNNVHFKHYSSYSLTAHYEILNIGMSLKVLNPDQHRFVTPPPLFFNLCHSQQHRGFNKVTPLCTMSSEDVSTLGHQGNVHISYYLLQ